MKRVLTVALAGAALALTSVPAQAQKLQGGQGAVNQLHSAGLSRDNRAQRRIRTEVKALRDELIAVREANGGVLPEPERLRLQARYNDLRSAFKRAG